VKETLFPRLEWMTNLKSLALIKLGPTTTQRAYAYKCTVRSLPLQDFLGHIFRDGGRPSSLQHLCVHQFDVFEMAFDMTRNLWGTTSEAPPMKSFCVDTSMVNLFDEVELEDRINNERDFILSITPDQRFDQLAHLAQIWFNANDGAVRPCLRGLKYVQIHQSCFDVCRVILSIA